MVEQKSQVPKSSWKHRLHEIIFEADTKLGKQFDVLLLWAIILSVTAVLLESVGSIRLQYGTLLNQIEWLFTLLFTVEYFLRLVCVRNPFKYAVSFFGIVDLLAIVPTYLSLIVTGAQALLVIRVIRLLRVFRVFKMARYLGEADIIVRALKSSLPKIIVFLVGVISLVLIMGTMMYLIEGEQNGFTSIPRSIYWAIVTMTTVGYGDLTPLTVVGQALAAIVMIMGYSSIAVPTGIVSAELAFVKKKKISTQACPSCSAEGHPYQAIYCYKCGERLNPV